MASKFLRRKLVFFLRHGQATHNVRAEGLRAEGCSYEAFVAAMAEDDEFDAALTQHGIAQATDVGKGAAAARVAASVELILSSPLSRAIDTADLVLPPKETTPARRLVREEWREISGMLHNARRLPRSQLAEKYAGCWDASALPHEEDTLWTEELERAEDCAERGYRGLAWIWDHVEEQRVAVAAHGGMFSFLMKHPRIEADERMRARFHNCELRGALMTAEEPAREPVLEPALKASLAGTESDGDGNGLRFRLQWVDLEDDATYALLTL